jgi:hypothetical protein
LFLIIIEGTGISILKAKRVGAIVGVKVGRDMSLTHQLFVDEIILCFNGSMREVIKFKNLMDMYKKQQAWR